MIACNFFKPTALQEIKNRWRYLLCDSCCKFLEYQTFILVARGCIIVYLDLIDASLIKYLKFSDYIHINYTTVSE